METGNQTGRRPSPSPGMIAAALAGVLIIVIAAAVAFGLRLGRSHDQAGPAASATPSTTRYQNPTFGYQLGLPPGWRHSTLLSHAFSSGDQVAGIDVFTIRSQEDEQVYLTRGLDVPGPEYAFVAIVEMWSNPRGLTPSQWWDSRKRMEGAVGQTVESSSLAGRSAIKIVNGPRGFKTAYWVPSHSYMVSVAYTLAGEADWQPKGASEAALQQIIGSFQFVP